MVLSEKGSVTVFVSLMLTVIPSLILKSLKAARTGAARAVLACAADETLFSLLGHYDRTLLEKYDLFAYDAGYGTDVYRPDALLGSLKEDMSRRTDDIRITAAALSGCTLMTDLSGRILADQAVKAAKDNALGEGLTAVSQLITGHAEETAAAEKRAGEAEAAAEAAAAEIEQGQGAAGDNDGGDKAGAPGLPDAADNVEPAEAQRLRESAEAIRTLRQSTVLDFVCPEGVPSEQTCDPASLPGGRTLNRGFGTIDAGSDLSGADASLWFDAYLTDHFGSLTNPEGGDGLQYRLEQILFGKNSDRDNLSAVTTRLLLIREGLNIAAIRTQPALKAAVDSAAAGLAALLAAPYLEPVLLLFLTAGWAYAESLLDIRTLYRGESVPAVKTAENWQVSLDALPRLISDPDSLRKTSSGGLSYHDYLRLLLIACPMDDKISRCADMIEYGMRQSRPSFRLDHCLDAVSVTFTAATADHITLTVTRTDSYRTL